MVEIEDLTNIVIYCNIIYEYMVSYPDPPISTAAEVGRSGYKTIVCWPPFFLLYSYGLKCSPSAKGAFSKLMLSVIL